MRMRTFAAAGLLSLATAVIGAGPACAADAPFGFELEGGYFSHQSGAEYMNVGGEDGLTWAGKVENHQGGELEVESGQ
ncbi:hypothetical protein [Streptomyces fumanus]|nr:hypothetical protein [Streptomyces fumanus]